MLTCYGNSVSAVVIYDAMETHIGEAVDEDQARSRRCFGLNTGLIHAGRSRVGSTGTLKVLVYSWVPSGRVWEPSSVDMVTRTVETG